MNEKLDVANLLQLSPDEAGVLQRLHDVAKRWGGLCEVTQHIGL